MGGRKGKGILSQRRLDGAHCDNSGGVLGCDQPAVLVSGASCLLQHVLDVVSRGQSVFFTGSAGTGKSFLLRRVVSHLRTLKGHDSVFVTASTGIAACAIGGVTIHRCVPLCGCGGRSCTLASQVPPLVFRGVQWACNGMGVTVPVLFLRCRR